MGLSFVPYWCPSVVVVVADAAAAVVSIDLNIDLVSIGLGRRGRRVGCWRFPNLGFGQTMRFTKVNDLGTNGMVWYYVGVVQFFHGQG